MSAGDVGAGDVGGTGPDGRAPAGVLRKAGVAPHDAGTPGAGYRPSDRRLAHEAFRRRRARRSALIAGGSTLATAVALYLLVVNSPAGRPPGRPSSTRSTRDWLCRRC